MKQTFYLAVVNREYKGFDGFYTVSPICENKEDAQKFLAKEYERLATEFSNFEEGWEIVKNDDAFTLIDYHNYAIWGWVEEIKVENQFTGHRFAYTIFSTEHIDGADDNDELFVEIVFTDGQQYRDKVYEAVDKIVERFKTENPSEEYGESSENRLIEDWHKEVGFDDGDLYIWFELHDII